MAEHISRQVIILGGGCGGLWLLYQLCQQGYSALLIEHKKLGQFASTANQSWLHTGAIYALNKEGASSDPQVINIVGECHKANQVLGQFCQEFCPDAIYEGSECLFLFDDVDDATTAEYNLKQLALESKIVNPAQIQKMEPVLLARTHLEQGLVTRDIAFDSYRILSMLAQRATESGGSFHFTKTNLLDLHISFNQAARIWSVSDGTIVAEAPSIVCAGGALIPHMLEERGVRQSIPIQKCLVAVLHQRICNRIISIRAAESLFLNLVPYESGTTVNAGGLDAIASDFNDRTFLKSIYSDLGDLITDFLPGLLNNYGCGTHFYVCQKLGNISHSSHPVGSYGNRHYFWIKEPSGQFFYFYPGKFTLAPIAAEALTKELARNLEKSTVPLQSAGRASPSVAHRPYWGKPSHIGKTRNQKFVFEPIAG